MVGNGLRLISFDCGGVRCLSQLKIMENIIHKIHYDRYPDNPDAVVLPCECFDAMSGSGAGGLIVVMFCKLRMSVEDTVEEFYKICQRVYVDGLSPEEKTKRLRERIEDLLTRRHFPADLKMEKDDRVADQGCPCFVVATLKSSIDQRVNLRSYRTRAQPASKATLVEAILATCATHPEFLPVSIGPTPSKQDLIGGAMSVGNPCRELVTEAYNLFGKESHVSTILSLGSGHLGIVSVPSLESRDDCISALRKMANNCEQTAQEMRGQLGHLGIYYRFSVEHGLERTYGVKMEDFEWINAQTQSYIQDVEVTQKIDECLKTLRLRQSPVTLEQLEHTGGGQPMYKSMPPLTSYFVLRNQPWEMMKDGILSGDLSNEKQKILVISGMGGYGKTQLVLHFAAEYRSRFKYSLFINGSTKESIQADIIHYVRASNASYSQASFSEALNFFSNPRNQPSLLIYDNLDDIGIDLTALLPECSSGVIIITTRNRSRGQLASPHNLHIELGVMSSEEAVDLILRSSRLNHDGSTHQAATVIAEELGNLPVALVQAGSYVHETACSCEQYLERLRSHKSEMMYTPAGDRLQRSAYKAFDISYTRLPATVRNMLHIISCIHFANFPLQAIATAARTEFSHDPFPFMKHGEEYEEAVKVLMETFCPSGKWDDYTMGQVTRVLQNYSLATFTHSGLFNFLRIHPLVHEWAFERLDSVSRSRFRHAASRLIAAASNEKTLHHYLVPHIDFLSSHAPEIPLLINERATFGHVLGKLRLTKNARPIWESIYNSLVERGPDYEIHVATAGMELADTFDEDIDEMENLEKKSIAIRERILGVEHLDTLDAKKELAGTYRRQGRMEESEALYIEVLNMLKRKPELELIAPKVTDLTGFLAFNYYRQGRYPEAEELQTQLLEVHKEELGDAHPDTLDTMRDLGLTYHSQGRYSEAEIFQEQVFRGRKEHLGSIHIDTIVAMMDLGLTNWSQGRYSEAEALQLQVLTIQREQLGDSHMNTTTAMSHLGLTFYSQGRHSEAEALHEQVLMIQKKTLERPHLHTVTSMSRLTYYSQGRYPEVEALQAQALEMWREKLGDTHPSTVTAMNNLASIYYSQRRYSEAEALQEQLFKIRKEQQDQQKWSNLVFGILWRWLFWL